MRLVTLQRLALAGALVSAMGALELSGAVTPTKWLLLTAAIAVSTFWHPKPRTITALRVVTNTVLLLFILWTGYLLIFSLSPILECAVELVLALIVAKLFQQVDRKDQYQLYALALMLVAVASVLDVGPLFAVLFFTFFSCTAAGLSLTHWRRGPPREAERGRGSAERVTWPQVRLVSSICLSLLVVSVLFFFLLPRVGLSSGQGQRQVTGFSNSIDLSDHGVIGLDDTVVMRVQTEAPVEAPYWRGKSFDNFDGIRWSVSTQLRYRYPALSDPDGSYVIGPRAARSEQIEQHIDLEPIASDILFALPNASLVEYPAPRNATADQWHNVSIDQSGTVFHGFGENQHLSYRVWSARRAPPPDADFWIPPSVAHHYFSLPYTFDARTAELAARITQNKESAEEKASAIEAYLSTHYAYSLELPQRGRHPLQDFLFEQPRGHCEFFSTAMVVLLRAVGVGARNVNGFHGGEWNAETRTTTVRRYHAHSWVEAYIPGKGWRTYDPTPSAGQPTQRPPAKGFWPSIKARFEGFSARWESWVLNYDTHSQLELLGVLDAKGEGSLKSWVFNGVRQLESNLLAWLSLCLYLLGAGLLFRRRQPGGLLVSVVTVGALLLVATMWDVTHLLALLVATFGPLFIASRFARPSGATSRNTHALSPLYHTMVVELARHDGFRGAPGQTPGHLTQSLASHNNSLYQRAGEFLRRYCELRFGPAAVSGPQLQAFKKEGKALKRELARARRG